MSDWFYIVYQDYEIPSLNLDYYVQTSWETVRYSVDGTQAILRINPDYLEFFNLSRALSHSEAVSLVSTPAWTRPGKLTPT